jgi:hypothetical protein
MRCLKCGNKLEAGTEVCPNCDKPVNANDVDDKDFVDKDDGVFTLEEWQYEKFKNEQKQQLQEQEEKELELKQRKAEMEEREHNIGLKKVLENIEISNKLDLSPKPAKKKDAPLNQKSNSEKADLDELIAILAKDKKEEARKNIEKKKRR